MKTLKGALIAVAVLALAGLAFSYSGIFDAAADDPHRGITFSLIEATRDYSITMGAHDVPSPPALQDPKLIASGAQEYSEMCTGCHLAPGMEESALRTGLYPKPPNLAEHGPHRSTSETFWILKHGLKMTGMPAWGLTHDDATLWSMVAFLQDLPRLSPAQYERLIQQAQGSGHRHGHAESCEEESGQGGQSEPRRPGAPPQDEVGYPRPHGHGPLHPPAEAKDGR
jgi:mono/diheme cytochrome c family protein